VSARSSTGTGTGTATTRSVADRTDAIGADATRAEVIGAEVIGADHRRAAYRVCFVCTGNICRSPMAEVVLRAMAADSPGLSERLVVSSAGTGNWHQGEPMDPRARQALETAGYRDHGHLARQFEVASVVELDLIVALDRRHLQILRGWAAARGATEPTERLVLLRQFDRSAGGDVDVPDPYYGDDADFAACLTMVEAGCRGLVATLAPGVDTASPAPP
jgi:protein-tyrosine phosphatase